MTQVPYTYYRLQSWRYVFISDGKKKIQKIVDFVPLRQGNIFNLGFGDLSPDGSIDDKANSNNGDIIKVLATVIDILREFTSFYPNAQVFFVGSTDERTRLYNRILKMYYLLFSKEFVIVAATISDGRINYFPYDPNFHQDYLAFLIKRIS